MALQYKWLLKNRSPICFAGKRFPQQVGFVGLFFFGICKILPQFGTYKYMCPRVPLSGNCTSLSSSEISKTTGSRCPARPPLGTPGCSCPSSGPGSPPPPASPGRAKGLGVPTSPPGYAVSLSPFFFPFFPGVKGRESQPSALAGGAVIKEE